MSAIDRVILNGTQFDVEGGINESEVTELIDDYVAEHHITGVTTEEVQEMVDDYLDGSADTVISDWLEEHPEATTTVQDGSITVAKLANDVATKIENAGAKMASTVPVGKIFDTGYAYSSWVHNNVKYDSVNDVICVIVNNSSSHTEATFRDILLYKIDPRTLKTIDVIEVNKSASSGKQFEVYGFEILSNGTYLFVPCYDSSVSGSSSNKLMVWKSINYGSTWTETEATVSGLTSASEYQWFGVTQLSSGMLVMSEYKTSALLRSSDNGSTWTAQKTNHVTHEPTFIDCGNNRVICYCRKTMYGTSNGAWNGTKQVEPAVYYTSTDGGMTWTWGGDSTSITEMTASNCACVISEGYADLYVCSRMTHGDAKGAIFHYFANLDDAFADSWGTNKVVLYPDATSPSDFSYIGGDVDNAGVHHLYYYDSLESGKTDVRYIMASRKGVPVPVNADKSNALSIPYSKMKTDSLLATLKTVLTARINDIIISGGGEVPDDMDGSYFITNGLYEAWDFTDETKYDATTFTQTGLKGTASLKRSGADWGQSTPADTSFNAQQTAKCYWRESDTNPFSSVTVANGYSIEIVVLRTALGTDTDWRYMDSNFYWKGSDQIAFRYNDSTPTVQSKYIGTNGHRYSNNVENTITQNVYTMDSTGVKIYQNGELILNIPYSDYSDYNSPVSSFFKLTHVGNNANVYYPIKFRVYSKALSLAEVKNNYKYEMSLRG